MERKKNFQGIKNKQTGFTLIELLVVVTILATLAGLTSVVMTGYEQDAQKQLTRVEMQRISNAIRRFKEDTGYWPKTEGVAYSYANAADAANYKFLFSKPDLVNPGPEIPDWEPEYAIGWNGPYIDYAAIKDISTDLSDCTGDPNIRYALVDRFKQDRRANPLANYCVVITDEDDLGSYKIAEFSGTPYLYEINFTHTNSVLCDSTQSISCIALRSFGPDGIDNGGHDAYDDIVFVLQVN
jgi:prepilin-type N-terminal cleavage/methylation domain-containing protein